MKWNRAAGGFVGRGTRPTDSLVSQEKERGKGGELRKATASTMAPPDCFPFVLKFLRLPLP